MVKGKVVRWLRDRGCGFLKVIGKVVFCRSGRVVGKEWLQVGDVVWVKVIGGKSREEESWKAVEAWPEEEWLKEVKRRKVREAVELAGRAAKVVMRSLEKGSQMLEEEDGKVKVMKVTEPQGLGSRLGEKEGATGLGTTRPSLLKGATGLGTTS